MVRTVRTKPAARLGIEALPTHVDETLPDRQRERRIELLVQQYHATAARGPMGVGKCAQIWQQLVDECNGRSLAQRNRMAAAQGLPLE